MTDEQIKQNAEEYASKVAPAKKHKTGIPLAINHVAMVSFIEGAHSRDEEIEELKRSKGEFLIAVAKHKKAAMEFEAKLDQLRNPWISIEERLPEVRDGYKGFSKNVLVLYRDQETGMSYITEAYYDFEYKGDGGWILANNDDEHFFYSDYQENGYIVTHWMCIPELKKGE